MTSGWSPEMVAPAPYRSTPLFDEDTLPNALRNRHNTKAGVWGLIRVIEGELKLTYIDPSSEVMLDLRGRASSCPNKCIS